MKLRLPDPTSGWAVTQRRMKAYAEHAGLGIYRSNSAVPQGNGTWTFYAQRPGERPQKHTVTQRELEAVYGKRELSESRRGRQPLTDTKLYSVTWAGGRQGNLTDREAVDLVRQLRNDWVQAGRSGLLNVHVWYRDGSPVPYADLERRFYPTGSPIPGRSGSTSEARRRGHRAREAGPTPVDDPFYVIQGAWSDGRISESFGFDDEDVARSEAWKLSKSPYFEGDYVRIITRDGELVWDSRGPDAEEGHRRRRR